MAGGADQRAEAADEDHPPGAEHRQRRRLRAPAVLRVAGYIIVALAVAVVFRLRTPGVPGYDGYYHFRHADLYVQHGLWMKGFPWLVYSTINLFSGDVGYGFHFFLTPFTFLRDEMLGMKLAAAVETAVVLLILYIVLRRHRTAYAVAWPFCLLFLAPPISYTFVMTRPQILTMGFSAFLLSFMVTGTAWGVLLASFALAFFHLNAFPLILAIVIGVAAVKGVVERRWEWHKWVAALAGLGAGWALRPNPLGVAKLEYHQIVVHETARHAQLPLLFGREWGPLTLAALGSFAVPILLWVAASLALMVATGSRSFKGPRHVRTFLWSSIGLSVFFFGATVLSTKRFTPFWATFAVIVCATAFTALFGRAKKDGGPLFGEGARQVATYGLAVLIGALAWGALKPDATHVRWAGSTRPRLRAVAEWLRDDGRPRDVVYNVDWSMFPELFFWNTDDYYVSGLDPVFLYAYDPQLYWKFHHISSGIAGERTYASLNRVESASTDTWTFIRDDLRASYVVLDRRQHAPLDRYLHSDPRFELVLADRSVALYAVGRAAAPVAAPAGAADPGS